MKWQPILCMLSKRLECICGSLAVIVVGEFSEEDGERYVLTSFTPWCQECYQKSPNKDDKDE